MPDLVLALLLMVQAPLVGYAPPGGGEVTGWCIGWQCPGLVLGKVSEQPKTWRDNEPAPAWCEVESCTLGFPGPNTCTCVQRSDCFGSECTPCATPIADLETEETREWAKGYLLIRLSGAGFDRTLIDIGNPRLPDTDPGSCEEAVFYSDTTKVVQIHNTTPTSLAYVTTKLIVLSCRKGDDHD